MGESSSAETLYNDTSACSCSEIGALTLPPNWNTNLLYWFYLSFISPVCWCKLYSEFIIDFLVGHKEYPFLIVHLPQNSLFYANLYVCVCLSEVNKPPLAPLDNLIIPTPSQQDSMNKGTQRHLRSRWFLNKDRYITNKDIRGRRSMHKTSLHEAELLITFLTLMRHLWSLWFEGDTSLWWLYRAALASKEFAALLDCLIMRITAIDLHDRCTAP